MSTSGLPVAPNRSVPVCPRSIVPPYLLEALSRHADPEVGQCGRHTLRTDAGRPPWRLPIGRTEAAAGGGLTRTISDAGRGETLPGSVVRGEGDPATGDPAADEAYDGLGHTYALFHEAFGRDSLDGNGLPLLATVHYGRKYDNAFFDGTQMVFGDGDGRIFRRFTLAVDVIGHELTHGVTAYTAALVYQGQSGALNESVSDVFGSMVKQRALGQNVDEADWLIGAGLFTDAVHGVALRSMKAPGTAYDDPQLGKDPQPADMSGYVETTDDNGGVHTNSGIPNHAFYLAATAIGGNAWEGAGAVWYDVLTGEIEPTCDFATFARLTVTAAGARFGQGSARQQAVARAWDEVGVTAAGDPGGAGNADGRTTSGSAVPAPDDPITVRRSGGIAGMVRERVVTLRQLPDDLGRSWSAVFAQGELTTVSRGQGRPDAFVYSVVCVAIDLDVTVPEHDLPSPVLDLLVRTLRE